MATECKVVESGSENTHQDREVVLAVIAWLRGAGKGDRFDITRGAAAEALRRLLERDSQLLLTLQQVTERAERAEAAYDATLPDMYTMMQRVKHAEEMLAEAQRPTAANAGGLEQELAAAKTLIAEQNKLAKERQEWALHTNEVIRGLNARIAELEAQRPTATAAVGHGGDIAAGHFRMTPSGWAEVSRLFAGTDGVIVLYHAAGWPNNKPSACG